MATRPGRIFTSRRPQFGRSTWTGLLDQNTGRGQLVAQIERSAEFLAVEVNDLYERFLRRSADADGLGFWSQFLALGGTVDQLGAHLIGSAEYLQSQGGGSDDGFLTALYRDVLGRAIDPSGQAFYRNLLDGTAVSRTRVALLVLRSVEADRVLAQGFFDVFLGRPADPDGLDFFVEALQRGSRDEVVMASIIASDEYFANL